MQRLARPQPTAAECVAAPEGFRRYLRTRGDRVTRARRQIFDHVMQRRDHFRADDVARELASDPGRVSRGTVYRTLALMEEGGFVRTLRDGGMHRHYEVTCGRQHHDHMVCRSCGAFIEFFDPGIRRGIETACRTKRFEQDEHRLVIFGLCERCRDRSEDAPRNAGSS